MDIVEAFATKNRCYQVGALLRPQGLMLHSIGTPQPSAAVLARYFDQYQPGGQSVCVHAFVQADGTVCQTLPWEMRGWHCGGAANGTHIGIEMTEPGAGMTYAEAAEQITGTYRTAVALFAQLCGVYGLDPLADGVIIGHAEGHRRGVGYTMDGFRRDVYAEMHKNDEEDDEDMIRYNTIEEVPSWAREEAQRLIDRGALQGGTDGRLDLSEDMLRTMIVCQRMIDEAKET